MKKNIILGTSLLFVLSLSSCSSLMSIKELDMNGKSINRDDLIEYFEDYEEFYEDEMVEVENKWYSVSSKSKSTTETEDLTTTSERTISGSFYYSKFDFENKIKLSITEKISRKGTDSDTDEKIDENITRKVNVVYLKGIAYIKEEEKTKTDDYSSEEVSYDKGNSNFYGVLNHYLGIESLDIGTYFSDFQNKRDLDDYEFYGLDNGLAYSYYNEMESETVKRQMSFKTLDDSYQAKEIKVYSYLNLEVEDYDATSEGLTVIKTKLFGSIKKPSNLSRYS